MKKIVAMYLIIIIPILLFSKPKVDPSNGPNNLKIDKSYIASINEFGFTLLDKLAASDSSHNIFISPASVFLALAMTNDGAEGTTEDAIQTTLQLKNYTCEQINLANEQLMHTLMLPDTSVTLDIANSLWLNHYCKLKPEYSSDCEHYYSAGCFVRDFKKPKTLSELNDWVKDKTKGKIPSILNELNDTKILIILNAIYFEGKWSKTFDSSSTKNKPFFFLDGTQKDYPRMFQHYSFKYTENSEYQAVSIPYGERYSMNIVLPRERIGLPKYVAGLNQIKWDEMISRLNSREGILELPRFKIDYFNSLVETLINLGMKVAFGDNANFSRMTDTKVCISDVLHKTYLEVDEKGTKAAAVTAVLMGATTSAYYEAPPPPFVMIIDHPFFCVIRDNTTGLNIFAGAIIDPKPGK